MPSNLHLYFHWSKRRKQVWRRPLRDGRQEELRHDKIQSYFHLLLRLTEKTWRPYPLFMNNRKEKLTRGGITYILKKYVTMARKVNPDIIPEIVSCHSLRHSKAMHLLQAGVNLVYIRDILGHVSIQTTEVYARADSKQKREAIQKAYKNVAPDVEPLWEKDKDLLQWLKSF